LKELSEEKIQIAIVNYLKLQYPKLLFTATMGGQYQKHHSQRRRAKQTGYLRGVSDLLIFEPRGIYSGLFIELKRNKKCYPTKEQKEFILKAKSRGYYAVCAKGFDECKEIIDNYLNDKL
jgi:hypothetical protein|tara:strand:- start:664 stop:1023 length:360 start_codon:yes stop_codon:yes gene_type:complete